jgi:hypothetical protein
VTDPIDRFYENLSFAVGIDRDTLPGLRVTAPTDVRLVGVTVGELAHALRFSGFIITSTGDGVQIRKQGDNV